SVLHGRYCPPSAIPHQRAAWHSPDLAGASLGAVGLGPDRRGVGGSPLLARSRRASTGCAAKHTAAAAAASALAASASDPNPLRNALSRRFASSVTPENFNTSPRPSVSKIASKMFSLLTTGSPVNAAQALCGPPPLFAKDGFFMPSGEKKIDDALPTDQFDGSAEPQPMLVDYDMSEPGTPIGSPAQRDNVAKEILSSEESFVRSLKVLQDIFLPRLKSSVGRSSEILDAKAIGDIFSNIHDIIPVNYMLLDLLRERIHSPTWNPATSGVGDIFAQLVG
ncbi:epithelial cell transforming sequence 2 oncoprotein-like, partial [Cladochytrium tenue]